MEGEDGGSVRGYGGREGVRWKPARTWPQSRQKRKGRGEVGGDGDHGDKLDGNGGEQWPRELGMCGNGSVALLLCHFAAVTATERSAILRKVIHRSPHLFQFRRWLQRNLKNKMSIPNLF